MRVDPTESATVFRGNMGRVAIVAARFHSQITEKLVAGAQEELEASGIPKSHIEVFWAPGAFELPQVAKALATSGKYIAIVPIGCLIRGETSHFDHIAHSAVSGLDAAARETGIAISMGIITVENFDQALDRAGGREGNKGSDAARAALEVAALLKETGNFYGKSEKSA